MSAEGLTLRRGWMALTAAALVGCAAPGAAVRPQSPQALRGHPEPELVVIRHKVAPGQNLYRIALAYGVTVEELSRANGIDDPRSLSVGQELIIPGGAPEGRAAAAPPQPRHEEERRAQAPPEEEPKRRPSPSAAPAPVEGNPKGKLQWPLRGVLYAKFGRKGKEPHDGIDLAAPAGTPVKTAAPGTVLHAGEQAGYGLIVIVEHGGGLITLYAHNQDLRVKAGQAVREGQVIATVGESGRTSGPHLHFEVRKDGVPMDPLLQLGPVPPR